MFDYNDFVHAKEVRHVGTGNVYKVDYVDPDVPYLVIINKHGNKYTCRADLLEPMDCKRVAV